MKKSVNSKFSVKENVRFILRDKDGNIKPIFQSNWLGKLFQFKIPFLLGMWRREINVSNLTTHAGLPILIRRAGGIAADPFTYLGIGIGTTAATTGDTALESEIVSGGGERTVITPTEVTTTVTDDTLQFNNTFTFTAPFNIAEAGIFNHTSAGTMLSRVVRAALPVIATDNLEITWNFKIA